MKKVKYTVLLLLALASLTPAFAHSARIEEVYRVEKAKEADGSVTTNTYHKDGALKDKLERTFRTDKDGEVTSWWSFRYDEKGNLVEVYSKYKKRIALPEKKLVERALAKARKGMEIPASVKAKVEYKDGVAIVTWPYKLPPRTKGPDYYAQVTINPFTGKILGVLGAP